MNQNVKELDKFISDLHWAGVIGDVVLPMQDEGAKGSFSFFIEINGKVISADAVVEVYGDFATVMINGGAPVTVMREDKNTPIDVTLRRGMEEAVYKMKKRCSIIR